DNSSVSNGVGAKELQIKAGTALSFGSVSAARLVAAGVFGASAFAYANSNTAGVSGNTRTTANLTAVTLGIRGGTTTGPLNGKIAEVLVYNQALTPAQIAQVNAYLGARYAINVDTPTYNQTTWEADELALHPEHVLTAAYDTLAGKVYPFSMPYNL